MKKALLSLVMTLFAIVAMASPVDIDAAQNMAVNFWNAHRDAGVAAVSTPVKAIESPYDGMYIFAMAENGFVIVASDDCVTPILGYSFTAPAPEKLNREVSEWLALYQEQIVWLRQHEIEATDEIASQWLLYSRAPMGEPVPLTAVSPLITTTWDQAPYYNNLCPYDANEESYYNNRVVTGCVATATAQIMKYHSHPTTGYGSHSYTHDDYGTLSANFGNTTYQWSNMPTALSATSSSTQVNAVATLMYHIGVADEMEYGLAANGGSGASNYNYYGAISASSQTSLMQYFKYRPDMAVVWCGDYSESAYRTILQNELNQSRPILYSGSNVSGGHSFVCDGYNTSNQFHFNWGWGGSYDGYFTIGSLNPGVGGIGGNSSGTYNMRNAVVLGIRPNTSWSTSGTTTVNATSVTGGSVSGTGSYSFGQTVSLTATANSGYRFDGWSDGTKFNPREFIANGGSYTFTPVFVPITGDTVTYCTGNRYFYCYGNNNSGSDKYWGIKIPAASLPSGSPLTAVQLYVNEAGTYDMTIYTGASRSTTAATATRTFSSSQADQWQTITLTTPVSTTQDLWITFHNTDVDYPAAVTYYSGAAYSMLWGSSFSDNGSSWECSAMIKGIFGSGSTPTPDPTCTIATFPYTENFNDTTADCWSVIDNNNDGTTWQFMSGTYGYNSTICIGIQYAANADDWLISPTIATAGNYTVSWKARIMDSDYPETYQVLWYDGTNGTQLFQETLTSETYVDRSANFSVPANGSGSIVFRYISDDMYVLFLDNIVISNAGTSSQYTISAVPNNSAYGSVTGGGTYNSGATATLTATANSGYHFTQWQDGNTTNPRTITVTGNATYTATFVPNQYTITVNSNNSAWGTVSGGGTYNLGTAVTISATANTGYHFVQWNDGNTNASRTITVTGNATYTATFAANQYTITAVPNNSAYGTVTGGGTYNYGANATLTATANSGYQFSQWQDGNTSATRTINVTGNATYTATFVANNPNPGNTDTISYCGNSAIATSVGAGGSIYWGIMLTPSQLSGHNYLKSVMLYVVNAGSYTLRIHQGGTTAPGTQVYSQVYTFDDNETQWQELLITTTFTINTAQNLWITFYNDDVTYPAAACSYVNNSNSDWASTDGSSWNHLQNLSSSLTYSWLIKAVTSNTVPPQPAPFVNISGPTSFGTGITQTFTATATNGATVTWTLNGATPSTATGLTASAVWSAPGTYNVIATATNSNGTGHDTLTVSVTSCGVINTFPYNMTFESSDISQLACWTILDVDGDGYSWTTTPVTGVTGSIGSASYINNVGALTPDNWLISPQIQLTAGSTYTLSWQTWGLDTMYYAEHYGVYVSTTGTATSNFTLLQQYTLSNADTTSQTLNLSSYAGQNIHIAFRHWNVTDQYWLLIDNISVTQTSNPTQQYTITAVPNNSAYGTVTGGGTYNAGSTVTLTATANSGYHFVQWHDGNTSNPRTITVTGNATYTATFAANAPTQYTITVNSNNPAWGTVSGGGTYNAGSTVTISATANTGYHFVQWNDGNTNASRTITVTGNATYTATFAATQYTITVVPNNSAYGTVTGGGTYNYGATATLTATASNGYHFTQWNDGNTQNPRTITVTGNATYTATFVANPSTQYTITVNSNNPAWGTVTGGGTYNSGATVTISATANSGYHFVQWQDGNTQNPRTITVTGNATYTATFAADAPMQYTITAVSSNNAYGTVTGGGTYNAGATATLTATANSGYHFTQWQDGNTENPRTITVTGNATYIATFEADATTQYTITVLSANDEMGNVSGGGTYDVGSTVTIRAMAYSGYHFTQWNDGNTDATRQITVTGDATYIASFEADNNGIETADGYSVAIYPNPATTDVTVSVDVPATLAVVDISGRTVMTYAERSTTFVINYESLATGAYYLRITTDDGITVRKLIVK